eukprot:TRINITY_DN12908_c0_g1_i1.p1 TRINITY_DN12908_c0_g1~~TRINITY_DN12908_c0_g1_i1.p1  ORF type:complete len:542 (-),score=111.64 TRINITY_DN12908_c0_g1_i1:127-1752(-)
MRPTEIFSALLWRQISCHLDTPSLVSLYLCHSQFSSILSCATWMRHIKNRECPFGISMLPINARPASQIDLGAYPDFWRIAAISMQQCSTLIEAFELIDARATEIRWELARQNMYFVIFIKSGEQIVRHGEYETGHTFCQDRLSIELIGERFLDLDATPLKTEMGTILADGVQVSNVNLFGARHISFVRSNLAVVETHTEDSAESQGEDEDPDLSALLESKNADLRLIAGANHKRNTITKVPHPHQEVLASVYVRDCAFESSLIGIQGVGVGSVSVENCKFTNCRYPIYLSTEEEERLVDECDACCGLSDAPEIEIASCEFESCTTAITFAETEGIVPRHVSLVELWGNRFVDCENVIDCNWSGVVIRVADSHIEKTGAVLFAHGASCIIFEGNLIKDTNEQIFYTHASEIHLRGGNTITGSDRLTAFSGDSTFYRIQGASGACEKSCVELATGKAERLKKALTSSPGNPAPSTIPRQGEDPGVLSCLERRKCTLASTGESFVRQLWWSCKTCGEGETWGLCESCLLGCHQEHELFATRAS